MSEPKIQFTNGLAYESFMGRWSQLVGTAFIDWLAPPAGGRWLDVGCGNGAFTEQVIGRCAPALVEGIDPSEAQVAYARTRLGSEGAVFTVGDAMRLPYPDNGFDIAVMPLVIFFLTDPALGVAEMVRVVAPGGMVTAYSWDMTGGGFPYASLNAELKNQGFVMPMPPSPEASRREVMTALWQAAGLTGIESREITVERTFTDVEDYWRTAQHGPGLGPMLAALPADAAAALQARLRSVLPTDAQGRITCQARANAIKGVVA